MTKAQIMKRAWEIKREDSRYVFGLCLKMAWAEAKREKDEKEALKQAHQWNGKVRIVEKDWIKYGKNRTYVEARVYTNGGMLKRVVKAGYQDNVTCEWVTDKELYA